MTDDQKLWDLLGRSPRPSAPPFFATRVMRMVGTQEARRPAFVEMALRWLAPAAVAALVLLAVLPRPGSDTEDYLSASELTTLELVGMLSPDDYQLLTAAGWPDDSNLLTGSP